MENDQRTDDCRACGGSVRPGDAFCARCGAAVLPGRPAAEGQSASRPDSGAAAFAARGQIRQNETYVGNRLMFTRNGDIEEAFANVVSGGAIWTHFKGVLVVQAVLWLVAALFLIPLTIQATLSFGGGQASGFAALLQLFFSALSIGLLVAAFTGVQQLPMSEWELLIDGRSLSADDAYAAVVIAMRKREIAARVYPDRIATDTTTGQYGNHLVVRDDPYAIYVTVLPYGTGLYLSWSMWREQRITTLYVEWFRQLRNRWAGAGTLLNLLLRAQRARALREAVHNALRDGVETAITERRVPLADAFGDRIPSVRTVRHPGIAEPVPPRPPRPPRPRVDE